MYRHVHVHVVLQVTLAPLLYILIYRKLFRVESGEISSVSEADGRVTIIQWNLSTRTTLKSTSVKIIQYGCRDAPCEKSWKQGNPLSNTIKDTSTIMRNPLSELCREGLRMIVLVSLIVLLRGFPCFHDFSHGASLHPYSFN